MNASEWVFHLFDKFVGGFFQIGSIATGTEQEKGEFFACPPQYSCCYCWDSDGNDFLIQQIGLWIVGWQYTLTTICWSSEELLALVSSISFLCVVVPVQSHMKLLQKVIPCYKFRHLTWSEEKKKLTLSELVWFGLIPYHCLLSLLFFWTNRKSLSDAYFSLLHICTYVENYIDVLCLSIDWLFIFLFVNVN